MSSAAEHWSAAQVCRQRGDLDGALRQLTASFLEETKEGVFGDNARILLEQAVAIAAQTGEFAFCQDVLETLIGSEHREDIRNQLVLNRVDLLWSTGQVSEALHSLRALENWTGPLEDIGAGDNGGLDRWWHGLRGTGREKLAATLGKVLSSYGQYSLAERLLRLGNRDSTGLCLANIAADCGRWEEALRLLDESEGGGKPGSAINVCVARMKIYAMLGEWGKALGEAHKAVRDAENSSSILAWQQALMNRAALLIPLNQVWEGRCDLSVASLLEQVTGRLGNDVAWLLRLADQRDRIGSAWVGLPGLALFGGGGAPTPGDGGTPPDMDMAYGVRPVRWLSYFEQLEIRAYLRGEEVPGVERFEVSESPVILARLMAFRGLRSKQPELLWKSLRAFDELRMRPDSFQVVRWLWEIDEQRREILRGELAQREADLARSLPNLQQRETYLLDKGMEADQREYQQFREVVGEPFASGRIGVVEAAVEDDTCGAKGIPMGRQRRG